MTVVSFDRRLRKLEAERASTLDEEVARLTDDELIAMLRYASGETLSPVDEALIAMVKGEPLPDGFDTADFAEVIR